MIQDYFESYLKKARYEMIDGGAVSTPKSKNFEVFGPSKQTIRQRNSVIEGRKTFNCQTSQRSRGGRYPG